MNPLEPPDSLHLRAAEGWCELGNHFEAKEELQNVAPEFRGHPQVLEVRWQIEAAARNWEEALEIAAGIIQIAPEEPSDWLHRSYALHELKHTQEARDNLLRILQQFPDSTTMRYNLACYECQLGRLDEARSWLKKVLTIGNPQHIKSMALHDPDLQPLWKEIPNL
jgi:tetratricopeptide (TPR) repeat protein